jgi:hypothetical protein
MATQQGGAAVRRSGKRPASAGIALAAAALTVAGCSQALPIGPAPATQHHLASAVVLQIVLSRPSSPAGGCSAGSARLPRAAEDFPGSGQCYRRIGRPLTITSAAVAYVQQPAANQQPASYGLAITVPAAGKTWGVPNVGGPFTGRFEIPAQNAKQALQL